MSALSHYNSFDRQSRRIIWVGYILYSAYIWLLGGYDDVIENIVPGNNQIIELLVALGLYWAVVFLILWATDK